MITLQFIRGKDFSSKAIEWFGHGARYSHVDTVMPDGRLYGARSDKVGGAPPGVQYRSPTYVTAAGEDFLRECLEMTNIQERAYYQFILAQLGKPYDERSILAFIAGRNWNDPDAWFCSELVAAGLEHCGYFPYALATVANKVDPAGLLLAISVKERVIVQ